MAIIAYALVFLCGGFASICLLVGLMALRRRTDRTLLAYAGMALCASLFAGVCAAIMQTDDLASMRRLVHWAGLSVMGASACSVLFFGLLLYRHPPRRYLLCALACVGIALVALASPGALRHMHLIGVAMRLTPWGERIHEELGPSNPLGIALLHLVTACVTLIPLHDAVRARTPLENRIAVGLSCLLFFSFWIWDAVASMTGWSRGLGLVLIAYPSVLGLLALWLMERERRLADRVAKLQEQQRQAQKFQTLGQLAGGIAHDFNNLLSGVLGAAELLGHSVEKQPGASHLLGIVQDAGQRAKELTSQLLSYSRRGRKSSEPVNLHGVVSATVTLAERTFDPRVRVVCSLEARHPFVIGDHAQLHAALLNLCINARDAMPDGGELRISSSNVILDEHSPEVETLGLVTGDYLRVRVSDTGTGMSAAVQRHLFEPFFTTKPEGKGTGLGLASTYGALAEHRGAIRVESREGHGTTFELLLPRADHAALEGAKAEVPPSIPPPKTRVLIADDRQMIREVSGALLHDLGYEVDTMSRAHDVLAHFKGGGAPYDCVVLDMGMPDMNGRDCFEALHALQPDLPIVMCSGFVQEETLATLQAEGLAGFIKKPFSGAEIARAIEHALGGFAGHQPA